MEKTPFRILFVCKGNIYRSRIAEAYLRSKQLVVVEVSSGGTQAPTQHKGPITWYALRLLHRHDLLAYMSPTWTSVNKEMILNADLIVFMGKDNCERCRQWLSVSAKYEVWDVPDFNDNNLNGKPLDPQGEIGYITASENTFSMIVKNVDKLIETYNLRE